MRTPQIHLLMRKHVRVLWSLKLKIITGFLPGDSSQELAQFNWEDFPIPRVLFNLLANWKPALKLQCLNLTLRRVISSRFSIKVRAFWSLLVWFSLPESLCQNSVCSSSTELDTRLSYKTRKRCLHPAELSVHPMNMQTRWLGFGAPLPLYSRINVRSACRRRAQRKLQVYCRVASNRRFGFRWIVCHLVHKLHDCKTAWLYFSLQLAKLCQWMSYQSLFERLEMLAVEFGS